MSAEKTAIFILGPPRSGTSFFASLLANLGVNFGDERRFVDPKVHRHNPKGFYELVWVNELNDAIFSRLGLSWGSIEFLTDEIIDPLKLHDEVDRIVESVKGEWGTTAPVIGIKDPRISLLFPLWESALHKMGYDVRCLIALRHPLGYLRSQQELHPSSHDDRMMLYWVLHILGALYFTRHLDPLIVDFDRMAADPRSTVRVVADWLSRRDVDVDSVAEQFDASLYHHDCGDVEVSNRFVKRVYETLRGSQNQPNSRRWIESFYKTFHEFWPLLRSVHGQEMSEALGAQRQVEYGVMDEIKPADCDSSAFSDRVAGAESREEYLAGEVATRDRTIEDLHSEIEQLRAKEADLNSIRRSFGWRLLSLYGRIKYPYLLPLYKMVGKTLRRKVESERRGQ